MKKEIPASVTEERLIAYFHHELEEREQKEVEEWLSVSEQHRKIYRQTCRTVLWIGWSRKEQMINEQAAFKQLKRKQPQSFLYRWRYAAALVILTILIAGGLLWKHERQPSVVHVAEVLPVSPKARLVLSTGQQIDLTREKAAVIEQNGSIVKWDSTGEIRYHRSSQDNERTLIYNRIEVPRCGEFQITLSDGTRVWLNAATDLEYPVEFAAGVREVKLQGEAYFKVAKDADHPFIVRAGDYRLQVYGTEFNLNTYDSNRIEAVLVKGSIGFQANTAAEEIKLKPNQVGIANPQSGDMQIYDTDIYPYIAWKNNDMVFVNERLESIMQKVERWYDVEVIFGKNELKELRFYGDIKRYADIRELLAYLEQTSRIRFKIENRTIVIIEK